VLDLAAGQGRGGRWQGSVGRRGWNGGIVNDEL
jgi:hypothetical protein